MVADGFKYAALGFAVAGVGLAIAGCFFPASGAGGRGQLRGGAGTAFVAADVSMAIGVGLDAGVAAVHPTPANQAVVVGDVVGLALGYGAGKLFGAAVIKFGPEVAEIFAQQMAKRAGVKASFVDFIESVEQFKGGARPELARQAHDLYTEGRWKEPETLFDRNGINDKWPPNRGSLKSAKQR